MSITVYGSIWPDEPKQPLSAEIIAKITARRTGFYRVKFEDDNWVIAQWTEDNADYYAPYHGYWEVIASDETYTDEDFKEINETLINPEP